MVTKVVKPGVPAPVKRKMGRPDNTPDPTSFVSRLAMLGVGEFEVKWDQVPMSEVVAEGGVNACIRRLERVVRKAVERATERSNGVYEVENGSFITRNQKVIVAVVVTRIK